MAESRKTNNRRDATTASIVESSRRAQPHAATFTRLKKSHITTAVTTAQHKQLLSPVSKRRSSLLVVRTDSIAVNSRMAPERAPSFTQPMRSWCFTQISNQQFPHHDLRKQCLSRSSTAKILRPSTRSSRNGTLREERAKRNLLDAEKGSTAASCKRMASHARFIIHRARFLSIIRMRTFHRRTNLSVADTTSRSGKLHRWET
jgi:hypothetical protein